jgi:hypothetical protein
LYVNKDDTNFEEMEETDQFSIPKKEAEEFKNKILEDIKVYSKKFGQENIEVLFRPNYMYLVRMVLDTSFLNEFSARAIGLKLKRRLIFEFEIEWNYLDGEKPFKITEDGFFETKETDLSVIDLKDKRVKELGVIRWYLNNR